MSTEGFFPWW